MFRNILVASDGSSRAKSAARLAARLAARTRAQITALYVVREGVPTIFSGGAIFAGGVLGRRYERALAREAAEALALVEREADLAGARCVALHAVARRPWRAIVQTAKARHCDLIVMASRARPGLGGLALGSETAKVISHSRLPVLVCR